MIVDDEVRYALKRQRMLVGLLRDPNRRVHLANALQGLSDDRALAALGVFSDGEVDVDQLSSDFAVLTRLASPAGVLAYGPIEQWPDAAAERHAFVEAVITRVFLGLSRGWLTETELTARLGMLFFDEAGLRRYAVDAGLLERESDGSRYWLAGQR